MNTDKIYAEAIANEYSVKASAKIIALQKLDRWVKRPAKISAFVFGGVSFLFNNVGLVLLIHYFNDFNLKLLGIALCAIGLAGMTLTCFVYERILEYRKRENAYDVIELAKEAIDRSIQ